jgi:hypothetical protein
VSDVDRVGPCLQPPEHVALPALNEERPVPIDEREEIRELLSHYLATAQAQSSADLPGKS